MHISLLNTCSCTLLVFSSFCLWALFFLLFSPGMLSSSNSQFSLLHLFTFCRLALPSPLHPFSLAPSPFSHFTCIFILLLSFPSALMPCNSSTSALKSLSVPPLSARSLAPLPSPAVPLSLTFQSVPSLPSSTFYSTSSFFANSSLSVFLASSFLSLLLSHLFALPCHPFTTREFFGPSMS